MDKAVIVTDDNGNKYSRSYFEDYKHRAMFCFTLKDGDTRSLDIYTTNTDKKSTEDFIKTKSTEKVKFVEIDFWTSKANDDAASRMIDEWLKELEEREEEKKN